MFEFVEVTQPYPGLRPFEPHEAEIFFGREGQTDRLLEILQRERFLAVLGPSGSGKSSLVRAGLLPALAAGWLGSGGDWRIALLRPGDRPLRRLAEALLAPGALRDELAGGEDPEAAAALLEAELRRGPLALAHLADDACRQALPARLNVLVLVDQFEELFRYAQGNAAQANESEAFVNLLLAARAAAEVPAHVALTMRTDFLGHCVRFLDLPEAINRAPYLTPRLSRAELENSIVGPARVFGGDIEPALANELINAVAGDMDQLPILQHLLACLWHRASERAPDAPLIVAADLAAVGGIGNALPNHADQVLNSLAPGERRHAEVLFRAITERQGSGDSAREIRRPARLEQIAAGAGRDWRDFLPVVRAYAREGVNFLFHGPSLDETSVIDISHEALIRQWTLLREWVADEAAQAAQYRRWRDRAEHWRRGGELLWGADLAQALAWRAGTDGWQPTAAWAARYAAADPQGEFDATLAYIDASEREEAEVRLRLEEQTRRHQELEQQRLEAEREAAEARAVSERERAEAAAARQLEAEAFACESQRQSRLMRVLMLLALLSAVVAGVSLLKVLAEREMRVAEITALIRDFMNHGETDLGALLAVDWYKIRPGDPAIQSLLCRAFEQVEALRRPLLGHQGAVNAVAFSPNGMTVATGSNDTTVQLWDTLTGQRLSVLKGHKGSVNAVAFSPDGTTIATVSNDKTARRWEAATGQPLNVLKGHQGSVNAVAFSPDGKTIATGSYDNTARLWEAATGQPLSVLKGHQGAVNAVAFSLDGKTIATGGGDNTARLWEAATCQPLVVLEYHEDSVSSVDFSPDGRTLATGSYDKTARRWEAATGQLLKVFKGHEDLVNAVAFSPDGKTIATGSYDNTVRLWEAATGLELAVRKGHEAGVLSVAFSPNGTTLASGSNDNTARLWFTVTSEDHAHARTDCEKMPTKGADARGIWWRFLTCAARLDSPAQRRGPASGQINRDCAVNPSACSLKELSEQIDMRLNAYRTADERAPPADPVCP